jgi:hypothetical protein
MKIKVSEFLEYASCFFSGHLSEAVRCIEANPCITCAYREIPTEESPSCQECEVSFSNWTSRKDAN